MREKIGCFLVEILNQLPFALFPPLFGFYPSSLLYLADLSRSAGSQFVLMLLQIVFVSSSLPHSPRAPVCKFVGACVQF